MVILSFYSTLLLSSSSSFIDTVTNNKIAQNHIKKILVGIDGSEKSFEAAEHAIELAKNTKVNCY